MRWRRVASRRCVQRWPSTRDLPPVYSPAAKYPASRRCVHRRLNICLLPTAYCLLFSWVALAHNGGMSATNGQLDTTIEIVTPENIAFRYRLAGPFRRLPAYLIDFAIRWFAAVLGMIALTLSFSTLGLAPMGGGMALVLWFLLEWFYGGVFEAFFNGQTPGKRLMQIRVVSVDGQPINGLQAVLRNVLRAVDAQPLVFYQLGLLTAAMNDRFQRLGDLAAGTMVVVEERPWRHGLVRTGEPDAVRLASQIPAVFQPSRTLARALAAYVERRRTFSPPRRLEIARHLAVPLQPKVNLPPNINADLLLCAVYHRVFVADREANTRGGGSPFMEPQSPFAPTVPDERQEIAEEASSGAEA
jgi:uncharacterized RDD family membrane protein YckC